MSDHARLGRWLVEPDDLCNQCRSRLQTQRDESIPHGIQRYTDKRLRCRCDTCRAAGTKARMKSRKRQAAEQAAELMALRARVAELEQEKAS